jgi:hypothetical protein
MAYSEEEQHEQIAAWERAVRGDREAARLLRCVECGRSAKPHDWPYCSFHASKHAIIEFFRSRDDDDDDDDDDDISGGHLIPSLRLLGGLA